jgi:hypothetical protein
MQLELPLGTPDQYEFVFDPPEREELPPPDWGEDTSTP